MSFKNLHTRHFSNWDASEDVPDAKMIIQAFLAAISPLGENAVRQVIADLMRYGVFLGDPKLTLEKLSTGIYKVFNDDAAHLILERVVVELDSMYDLNMRA